MAAAICSTTAAMSAVSCTCCPAPFRHFLNTAGYLFGGPGGFFSTGGELLGMMAYCKYAFSHTGNDLPPQFPTIT